MLTTIDSFLYAQENLEQKMEKLNLNDFWFLKSDALFFKKIIYLFGREKETERARECEQGEG